MISNKDVFDIVQSLAQKQKHGTISISEYDKYANMASMDLFNERMGSERDYYKLGKGIAKTGPGMNKQVDASLNPFLVPDKSIVLASGTGLLPSDCELIDTVSVGGVDAKWVPKFKVNSYLKSTIDVPTAAYPIYSDSGLDESTKASVIKVYPTTITAAIVTYYRTPKPVKYGYTVDTVKNRPVYQESSTVNFEWSGTEKLQLVFRICKYLGLAIRDNELIQVSEQEKNTIA